MNPAITAPSALFLALLACSSGDGGDASGSGGSGNAAGSGGAGAGGGTDGEGLAPPNCPGTALTPTGDYGAPGPFATVTVTDTGPDGQYTLIRPATPGAGGFKHAPATWGNGIFTMPEHYGGLLDALASHGFVVIASNSTQVNAQLMTAGLDWLLAQNDAPGELQGHLATDCAVTIGYSLGGGGSITAGVHPSVVTTVSFHGLQAAAEDLHGPLLLLTSTNDGFVTKAGYTVPTYERSTVVPTVMATLEVPGAEPDNIGHLIPLGDAGEERAPAIAWLRYWVYGDAGARPWFYGPDCVLCKTPWTDIQRKNADWD
jgi:hypothetical protein